VRSSTVHTILNPPAELMNPRIEYFSFFKKRWVYHTLFWLIYFTSYCLVIVFGLYQIYDLTFYLQIVFLFPFDIALAYFNMYFLVPRYLSSRKYLLYGFALFLAILATTFLNLSLQQFYVNQGSKIFALQPVFGFAKITGVILERFYFVGLTTAIKLAKDWIQNQRRLKEMEKQYLESELNFLKTQIQPHFFFNTLNNLYSLTLKKSDLAPEVVLKLSELMSYMLYESNAPRVSLNKEITYLQNYLDLEKLRFGQRLTVLFEIEGETTDKTIPPLILILFVENSFKHGVKNIVNDIFIEIGLKIEKDFLHFTVTNPVEGSPNSKENNGIGLKNVRRRLDLLFGNRYQLDLQNKQGKYRVLLKIPV